MTTRELLHEFTRFAEAHLLDSPSASLDDLYRQWRRERETQEVLDDIRAGLAEFEAGKCRPIDEVMDEIRNSLGFSEWPTES